MLTTELPFLFEAFQHFLTKKLLGFSTFEDIPFSPLSSQEMPGLKIASEDFAIRNGIPTRVTLHHS